MNPILEWATCLLLGINIIINEHLEEGLKIFKAITYWSNALIA